MVINIDLSKYCKKTVMDKGWELFDTYGISRAGCTRTAQGDWLLTGKSVDGFNFVNHPHITVDDAGSSLLEFGCDCSDAKRNGAFCEHCVALSYMWKNPSELYGTEDISAVQTVEQMPAEPLQEEMPVQEPVAVPVPEPEEMPVEEIAAEAEEPTEPIEVPAAEPEQIRSMEILLGNMGEDAQPVLWCPNDTEQVFHTNVGIIGTMGTGKTQFAKSLLTQLYRCRQNNFDGYPLGILIFDYKGDYNETKADFVQAANARVLKPYKLPYNPLALNPGASFKPLLPMHTANEFKDTISQIYGLGPKQEQLLLDCIVKAYAKQGIAPADPATWTRVAPTIEQVYEIFENETMDRPADKLTAAMNKLHQFCLFEADPRRAVSLDALLNGVVVIDLSGYDNDIQSTIVAITLNQFYAQMHKNGSSRTDGRYRQLRKFILVDEADTFMSQDFPSLRKIMKEGREFGVGVILSTQSLTHFVGGEDDYSRYVLTWIVHNVGDLKQRDVEYVFKLPPKGVEIAQYYATIKGLKKHESMVKLGNNQPITMHNKAFYQLYQEING